MRWLTDKLAIRRYLRGHATKKLHLGCGKDLLHGWLNSDRRRRARGVVRVDAAGRFPFADAVFDYVFSAHLIEHLDYAVGLGMLRECHRVLASGGKIRVSTPDLAFLLDLCRGDRTALQDRYIEWATNTHVKAAPYADAVFVLNNFVRDWGHRFIYDERSLRHSLSGAGFSDVERCEFDHSEDPELAGLENEARMPEGFLRLEALTLEAVKR